MKKISLKMKFSIMAVLISLISFSAAAFLSARWMANEAERDHRDKAELIGTHIIQAIGNAMIFNVHGSLAHLVDAYRDYKDVVELRLFNHKGDEILSKGAGPPDPLVKETLATGQSIHVYKRIDQKSAVSYIIPIVNQPDCHRCHGKDEALRGALLLSLDQEQVREYIRKENLKFFALFGFIAVIAGVSSFILVDRFFFKPINLIQKGAETIKRGNFDFQIPVSSRDEIGALTENFNHMAQALREKNDNLWEQLRLISQSEMEWQETFDSITDLICIIDKDFNITKANRAFHHYCSISPDVTIGEKCYEVLGICIPEDCPHLQSIRDRTALSHEARDQKTGKVLYISYFPYSSPKGEFTGTILIAKDVTEKKENEIRLIANERLAALGEMASGVAHEFNNPLATISVCTESLLGRVGKNQIDPPLFENYLKTIDEEIRRCKKITTDMLSFVRDTNRERKKIDLHEVLNKSIEMIHFQGRLKDVAVFRDFQDGMPPVYGNEGELTQVFISILVNALDAMENRGALALTTGVADNTAFVKIRDSGPGIPPGLINRIFEPFFTTKSERGGTGLGLSIANKIMKEFKGRIEASSENGKGATFTIILPV